MRWHFKGEYSVIQNYKKFNASPCQKPNPLIEVFSCDQDNGKPRDVHSKTIYRRIVLQKNFGDNSTNLRVRVIEILKPIEKFLAKYKLWDCTPHISPISRQKAGTN
jgi:hypothetical protein